MPGKVDLDKAKEFADQLEKGDRNYWTPSEGKNSIRLMPPRTGVDEIKFNVGYHYNVGPDDMTFPCPRLSDNRSDCFLCTQSEELKASDDEDDQAEARELRPTKKYLLGIVDLFHPEEGVQVWPAGKKVMREIMYYFGDSDWGDISNLDDGTNLTIVRSGTGLNTEYQVKAEKKESAFPSKAVADKNPDLEEIANEDDLLPDLSVFLDFPTNAEMEAAYEGTGGAPRRRTEKRGEEDAGDKPQRRSRRERASPNFEGEEGEEGGDGGAEDPDPEDPDDPDDPSAEDPEEKPRKKSRRGSARRGSGRSERSSSSREGSGGESRRRLGRSLRE